MAIRESEYFLAWLVFWLGALIGGVIAGAIGGGVVGLFLGASGVDLAMVRPICSGVGVVMGAIVSYLLFRLIVGEMIVSKAETRIRSEVQSTPSPVSQTFDDLN